MMADVPAAPEEDGPAAEGAGDAAAADGDAGAPAAGEDAPGGEGPAAEGDAAAEAPPAEGGEAAPPDGGGGGDENLAAGEGRADGEGGEGAPAAEGEAPAGEGEAGADGADGAAAGDEGGAASPAAAPGSPEPGAEGAGAVGAGDAHGEDAEDAAGGGDEGDEDKGSDDEKASGGEMTPGGAGDLELEGGIDSAMVEGDGDDDEYMEEEEDKVDPLQELQEKYHHLQEVNEQFMQTNAALQRRVIQRKMQDKSFDAEKPSEGKVTEHRYQNNLQNVHSVRLKLRLQQVKAARMSEELKNQLETKRQKAIECRDSFQEFKRQVARHAEYARTGKKIPERIIQEVEEFELDKDAEVEEVRGSNISLKNRLAKLEQALRKKDELAENLHVIDFEQLKIENQTLNEKIEERNEELHKLRKKTIVTVQIITHMREKVQFVQQEYQALKGELSSLDQHLAAQRDLVAKTKHERDEHRSEYGKLRQQTGIMGSEHLTKDFETRAENIKKLKEDIGMLKKRHSGMLAFIKRHGGNV